MRAIFPFLLIIQVGLLVVASFMGLMIDSGKSGLNHLLIGFLTAVYTMFLHCLVMFYLIGSGKDVKTATEDYPDLWEKFLLRSKKIRMACFPYASLSVILILLTAFAGAWVHGELISDAQKTHPRGTSAEEIKLAVRDVKMWWVHLTFLTLALIVNIPTFFIEKKAINENGQLIHDLNNELLTRIYPAEGPATGDSNALASGDEAVE